LVWDAEAVKSIRRKLMPKWKANVAEFDWEVKEDGGDN
jgi:hypothetical protein